MSEEGAHIVKQFLYVLEEEGWDATKWAIERIVNTSLENKERLRTMLSHHSAWDAKTMRITLPIDYVAERLDVPEKMDGLRTMCKDVDTSALDVFAKVLIRGGVLTADDCSALQACDYHYGRVGQKIGRAINAWAVAKGIDKHKEYNWRFNELINGGRNTTDRIAILSVNPVDFLLASHGDFTSCHSINADRDSCHKSGNLSYAMDSTTMVFFTTAPGVSANYPTERIDRINYHWDSGLLIQGRLYTSTHDNIHAVSRAMTCKAIADCLDVPNLWTKHAAIDQSRIISVGNHYPDYTKNASACNMLTLLGMDIPDTMRIGHVAYCISCGEENDDSSLLDCCEEPLCCESCGTEINEDDAVWVGDYRYCSGCTAYCDHCDEPHLAEDVKWVDSLGKHLCENCLREDFSECVDCGATIPNANVESACGDDYCTDCYHKRFSTCDVCGTVYDRTDLQETDGGECLCPDCWQEQDVAETNETLAA